MNEEKTEGIVLKSYIYGESGRILHLFTPDAGVIHLIVKRLSPKNSRFVNLATPLCHGHYVYRRGKTELHPFLDGSIVNLHLPIRSCFSSLNYAGKMLQALHTSQMPEKPAPKLFKLFLSYLKKLPEDPAIIWSSFQLKLLHYEGLISFSEKELNCHGGSFSFSDEEWLQLMTLLQARDFSLLFAKKLLPTIQKISDDVFNICLRDC